MNRIVFDTETTNSMDDPLVYDIGWAVVDDDFNVLKTYSFVVADIYTNKDLMESAYYKDKRKQYNKDLKNGTRKMKTYRSIKRELAKCCKENNVTELYAHNASFDYRSTQKTIRYITKSKERYFLPYGVQICDTLKMCRQTLTNDVHYVNFCEVNNFTTKNGKPRFTAEIVYKFLTQCLDFTESHTGLEDVLIEKEIMAYCFSKNPTVNPYLWNN